MNLFQQLKLKIKHKPIETEESKNVKDFIDKHIDFYYKNLHDLERFHMRAMMTSFGKDCFYAGKDKFETGRGADKYPTYIDFIKDKKKNGK